MSFLSDTQRAHPELAPVIGKILPFESAQNRYADLGAHDTEPDEEWHFVLREAAHGRPYPEQREGNPWHLFSGMRGAGAANRRLTQIAKRAHESILHWRDGFPAGQWRETEMFLRGYCWRVCWK